MTTLLSENHLFVRLFNFFTLPVCVLHLISFFGWLVCLPLSAFLLVCFLTVERLPLSCVRSELAEAPHDTINDKNANNYL